MRLSRKELFGWNPEISGVENGDEGLQEGHGRVGRLLFNLGALISLLTLRCDVLGVGRKCQQYNVVCRIIILAASILNMIEYILKNGFSK